MDDSVKMNHLNIMVTSKAKEAIAGLGYTAEMHNVAWNILVRNFEKPQMIVNAQLKRIFSIPPKKTYDVAALIKYAIKVSSCVSVLKQSSYVEDRNSDGVQGSATRKLTLDMRTKWHTFVNQMNLYQPGLAVFGDWLNDIAQRYSITRMLIARSRTSKKRPKALRLPRQQQTQQTTVPRTSESVLEDGKHPIWKCEEFKKMSVEESGQKTKELKVCFKSLSDAHQMRICSGRLWDVNYAGNFITDCYIEHTRTWNKSKMLKMSMRFLTCPQ